MIAIYRGEDTDFAGQEPIQVKIITPFDLMGYTADIMFGSITKHFESEEVATKTLGLSYTAAETSTFFPGRGFASIKVYDTEGRVAILKRFVIDVRFRPYDKAPISNVEVSELIHSFENLRAVARTIPLISPDDDLDVMKNAINELIAAAKQRGEFTPLSKAEISKIPNATILAFTDCIQKLEAMATDSSGVESQEDLRNAINDIISTIGGDGRIDIDDPQASVNSLVAWAKKVGRILRTQRV